jgi:hypothetical protein
MTSMQLVTQNNYVCSYFDFIASGIIFIKNAFKTTWIFWMNFIMFSVDWNIKLEILEHKWIPYEWTIFQNGYKDVHVEGEKAKKSSFGISYGVKGAISSWTL